VFFATFLQATYNLSLAEVAIPLAVFALGSIAGTVLGGQLADRLPNRLLTFAGAMFASAGAALALFGWTSGLAGSVALGFGYVFVNAIARPSLMAALANVPDEVRGTVLGLNVTSASLGWLGAAALGGWMMAQHGFAGFGPLAAGVAVLGGLSAAFLYFPINWQAIGSWGYLGIFGVVLVATASVALPIPYLLIVARAGIFLDPWLVGAVAGVAAMLGEMTGYIVGVSGRDLIARGKWYDKAEQWLRRHGFGCVAFFSFVPNPFFDAIGFAAGVMRYSVWRFAAACLIGKGLKFLVAALTGDQAHLMGLLD
jgi:membrane protein DedA with SNARE-associated domain